MPTYEYVCQECGFEFRKFQKMSDAHLTTCPECQKETLKRKIGTGAGLIFKGSGFYCTDYAHNSASPSKAPACEHAHTCSGDCACKHNS